MENQINIAKKRINPFAPNFAGRSKLVLRQHQMSNHNIISNGLDIFGIEQGSKSK